MVIKCLRPNLEKGNWTKEEDKQIVELQSVHGNKYVCNSYSQYSISIRIYLAFSYHSVIVYIQMGGDCVALSWKEQPRCTQSVEYSCDIES